MQNSTFPAGESPAATRLEALHAAASLALACDASSHNLWDLPAAEDAPPLLRVATEKLTAELEGEQLRLATVDGPPQQLQEYGLALYAAADTLPALFNRLRCAARRTAEPAGSFCHAYTRLAQLRNATLPVVAASAMYRVACNMLKCTSGWM
jgi:hypothetical protein